MDGELLRLGPMCLYSYGTALSAGFFAAVLVAGRQARHRGFEPTLVVELAAHLMVTCFIAGRLGYALPDLGYYLAHPRELLLVSQGGLSYVPAFLAGTAYVWWFARVRQLPVWELLDVLAPGLAAGLIVGSWGAIEWQPLAKSFRLGRLFWSPPIVAFFTIEYVGLWYLAASRRRLAPGRRFCQVVSLDAMARTISSGWAWLLYGDAFPHALSVFVGTVLFLLATWQGYRLEVRTGWHWSLPVDQVAAAAEESAPRSQRRKRLPVRQRLAMSTAWLGIYILLLLLLGRRAAV